MKHLKRRKRRHPLVFVSYRRDDPDSVKAFLYEKLARLLPEYEIFRDQQSISPASDYQAALIDAVLSASLVVVMIDDAWYLRWSRDPESGAVVDDANDWVFREIQTAIHHNVTVLPIVIYPSHEPRRNEIPPSIEELACRQAVVYHPIPDPDGSAIKVVDAVRRLLSKDGSPVDKWTRRALALLLVFLVAWGASWFSNREDLGVEQERFDKELEAIRLSAPAPTRHHPANAIVVSTLGQPDYSQLLILGDERFWDLRGFRQVKPDLPPLQSAVELTRYLRIIKRADVKEIRFEARTSGAEVIIECTSHPALATEYIAEATTVVAGETLKVRQVSINVADIPVGHELPITLHATYWDSLQSPAEWWLGAIGYPGSDYVRMLIVFPHDKPYKQYRLDSAPNSREKAVAFSGRSLVLSDRTQNALLWQIPKPTLGHVFRLSWDW